ncbi:MAG: hypothetical protein AB7K09_13155 [Planctomycetota bacterium]
MISAVESFARRCRRLAFIAAVLAAIYAVITIGIWLVLPSVDAAIFHRIAGIPPGQPTPDLPRLLLGLSIALLHAVPAVMFLLSLAGTLRACADAPIFPPAAPRGLRRMAWSAGLYAVGCVAGRALLAVWATWTLPPGQRSLTVNIGSGDLTALFVASLVALLASAFDAAAAIEAESRLTV